MPFTITSNSYSTTDASPSINMSTPSGTETGDILVVGITCRYPHTWGHTQPSAPTGWTKLAFYDEEWMSTTIFYRNAPENSGNYTFTFSGPTAWTAFMVRVGGGENYDVDAKRSAGGTSCQAASLVNPDPTAMSLIFYAALPWTSGAATLTVPTSNGWTSLGVIDKADSSGWWIHEGVIYKESGTDRPTATTSKNVDWQSWTVTFTPTESWEPPPPEPELPATDPDITAVNNLPIPQMSDPQIIPVVIRPLASAADSRLVARFNTIAERDAAIGAPNPGMLCYCADSGELYILDSSSRWVSARPRIAYVGPSQIEVYNNTTTFANSTNLFFSVEANSVYMMGWHLNVDGSPSADMKFRFSYPSGTKTIRQTAGSGFSLGTNLAFTDFSQVACPINVSSVGVGTENTGAFNPNWGRTTFQVYGTAGTVYMQFAQNSAVAANTRIGEGSFAYIWKLT